MEETGGGGADGGGRERKEKSSSAGGGGGRGRTNNHSELGVYANQSKQAKRIQKQILKFNECQTVEY